MIAAYHRPKTIDEALTLLQRSGVKSCPLAGGTSLSLYHPDACEVVDLQSLELNFVRREGDVLVVGAGTSLQKLFECEDTPLVLREVILREKPLNVRNVATLAGVLVCSGGRSVLATLLLAMDARLVWLPGEKEVRLGDWLPLRQDWKEGILIHSIRIPLKLQVAVEVVARSPMDQAIVCLAAAGWPSGRVRLTAGGWGKNPVLVADGIVSAGLAMAAQDACTGWSDAWASAEYRQEVAGVLANRLVQRVQECGS